MTADTEGVISDAQLYSNGGVESPNGSLERALR